MKHLVFILTSLTLAGCPFPKGDLDQKWVGAINEYGINPMFPPKEDYYIGNVYLHAYNKACEGKEKYQSKGCDFTTVRIGQLPPDDILKLLESNYGNTWSFKAGSDNCTIALKADQDDKANKVDEVNKDDANANAGSDKLPDYIAKPSRGCYASDEIKPAAKSMYLRRVGFPDFYKNMSTGGSLAASLPINGLPNLGMGVNDVKSISVSIPAAQYYSVSPIELISYLRRNKEMTINPTQKLKGLNNSSTISAIRTLCDDCKALIIIPYEIYYSTIFDVEYSGDFSTDVGFTRSRTPEDAEAPYKAPTADKKINIDELMSNPTTGNFGISAKITHASKEKVGIRRTFDTPLAVGYRGLSLELSKVDDWLDGKEGILPAPHPGDIPMLLKREKTSSILEQLLN
ncbi:hypothetical protein [Pseudomonas donghuensis]|uniref:hypothetical protein n=1 Tax=Pseudomonas donghuensis TaxID=1163398 RepID=UPI002E0E06BF|nr:hypothetical protein VP780_10960 [Pseudomonas donghuensis]